MACMSYLPSLSSTHNPNHRATASTPRPPPYGRSRILLSGVRGRRPIGPVLSAADTSSAMTGSCAAGVQATQGLGGLPMLKLTSSSSSSEAEIYAFGACVTSWKNLANGRDLLYVRPDAVFNGQKPISGGIPHCFPQFGPGIMQQHGFARNMNWELVPESSEGDPSVTFKLRDDPYSRSMWDFGFEALYKVTLHPKSLATTLTVTNTDRKPLSFSSALHTYFSASVSGAQVKGLKGCKTLNKVPDPSNPTEGKEERDVVDFPGFVDCIYLDAPSDITLENGLGDVITIRNTNWSDVVLWNPYLSMESCYKDFVCVENAKIRNVQLEPEETWVAEQEIVVD